MNLIKCPTCNLYTEMIDESGPHLDGFCIWLLCTECKTVLCAEIAAGQFHIFVDEAVPARRVAQPTLKRGNHENCNRR